MVFFHIPCSLFTNENKQTNTPSLEFFSNVFSSHYHYGVDLSNPGTSKNGVTPTTTKGRSDKSSAFGLGNKFRTVERSQDSSGGPSTSPLPKPLPTSVPTSHVGPHGDRVFRKERYCLWFDDQHTDLCLDPWTLLNFRNSLGMVLVRESGTVVLWTVGSTSGSSRR